MAHQEQHDGGTDSRLGTAFSTFTMRYAILCRNPRKPVHVPKLVGTVHSA